MNGLLKEASNWRGVVGDREFEMDVKTWPYILGGSCSGEG